MSFNRNDGGYLSSSKHRIFQAAGDWCFSSAVDSGRIDTTTEIHPGHPVGSCRVCFIS